MRGTRRPEGIATLHEGGESGQSIVEFAIVAPILLLLMGGVVDGAWLFHQAQSALHAAANAAQRGALLATGSGRCAGGLDPTLEAAITEAARRAAPSLDPSRLAVTATFVEPACVGRLRTLQVSTSYPLQAFMPYLGALLRGTRYTASTSVTVEMVQVPWSGQSPPAWWGQAPPEWYGKPAPAWWGQSAPPWWDTSRNTVVAPPPWWGASPPPWWGAPEPAWWQWRSEPLYRRVLTPHRHCDWMGKNCWTHWHEEYVRIN